MVPFQISLVAEPFVSQPRYQSAQRWYESKCIDGYRLESPWLSIFPLKKIADTILDRFPHQKILKIFRLPQKLTLCMYCHSTADNRLQFLQKHFPWGIRNNSIRGNLLQLEATELNDKTPKVIILKISQTDPKELSKIIWTPIAPPNNTRMQHF